MNRVIGIAIVIFLALLGGGLFLTWIAENRANQDRVYCANNLRILAQFAATRAAPPKDANPDSVPNVIPPGTMLNPRLAPENRLAWTVPALLTFDQRTQDTATLFAAFDLSAGWDQPPNAKLAETRIQTLICYANPPERAAGEFQPTQYVGTAGVGVDAATLALGPPVPPDAGCWRYDGPTPFGDITDGLGSTMLFAETNHELGPWSAGGRDTLRGLIVGPEALPVIGIGGQFGGNHLGGGNFAFADGSVKWLQEGIDPSVFRSMVTIAGDGSDPLPGD